jgi:hypothetical protein
MRASGIAWAGAVGVGLAVRDGGVGLAFRDGGGDVVAAVGVGLGLAGLGVPVVQPASRMANAVRQAPLRRRSWGAGTVTVCLAEATEPGKGDDPLEPPAD